MSLAEKSLAVLGIWCIFALVAGIVLGRLFALDRREVGADEAFDTLPDLSEPTPLYDALSERYHFAQWEVEYFTRGADQ